jgi:hypothetical protein
MTSAVAKVVEGRERERRQKQLRTAFALSRIGSAAIPQLLEALAADDGARRAGAATALGGMQAAARTAIPALIKNLADGEKACATRQSKRWGKSAGGEAALLATLTDGDAKRRAGAALALGQLGEAARDSATRWPQCWRRKTTPRCAWPCSPRWARSTPSPRKSCRSSSRA